MGRAGETHHIAAGIYPCHVLLDITCRDQPKKPEKPEAACIHTPKRRLSGWPRTVTSHKAVKLGT